MIFIISYFFLTIWLVAVALSQSVAQVLVFRFLAGFFGSSPLSNAGGVISDVLDANQRGLGMALFAAAPFVCFVPVTCLICADKISWDQLLDLIFLVLIVAVSETYAPTLLRRRAATMSKVTGNVYRFRADAKKPLEITALFKTALVRPWIFLIL
jgi:MFS family permease